MKEEKGADVCFGDVVDDRSRTRPKKARALSSSLRLLDSSANLGLHIRQASLL